MKKLLCSAIFAQWPRSVAMESGIMEPILSSTTFRPDTPDKKGVLKSFFVHRQKLSRVIITTKAMNRGTFENSL